jgi:hypothetical protein
LLFARDTLTTGIVIDSSRAIIDITTRISISVNANLLAL